MARRRKRVSVLYEVWWPESADEPAATPGMLFADERGLPREEAPDVHSEVIGALDRLGYAPQFSVLDGERESLSKLARSRTSLIFNLTESYAGDDTKDFNVAAYLELIGIPFTGSDARALHLGQDKVLTKKLLKFHDIPTPDFVTVERHQRRFQHDLPFPLIVKPSREDGSIGIDTGSVVHDERSLRERVRYVQRTFEGAVLVERYIDGRELYAGIIGNDPPEALPLVELDLSSVPEGVPRIAGTEVKWWTHSAIYEATPPVYPKKLPRSLGRKVQRVAVAAYRALGLRDYGRIDLRLTPSGEPYVLEVNPNPWLSSGCELYMAWKKSGRTYDDLIARVAEMALSRA